MSESSPTSAERRRAPRTKLVEIAYIGMGPENGGLVLDVSDGGLSFHAVAPVQPAETIHFLLSLRGKSRIEGAGEVVWTNEMRTICGLRFTSLSGGAREHLNHWANPSRFPAPAIKSTLSSGPALSEQIEAPTGSSTWAATEAETEAHPETEAETDQVHARTQPIFAIPPANDFYISDPESKSLFGGQIFLWIIYGVLGVMLLASAYLYGVHVGQTQVSSAARPVAGSGSSSEPPPGLIPVTPESIANDPPQDSTDAQVSTPTSNTTVSPASNAMPAPAANTPPPAGVFVNASKSEEAAPSSTARTPSEVHAAPAIGQSPELAADAGKSELAAGLAYLNGDNGKRDTAAAVRLLWAAVGNGNSEAEVILSDLYVNGDGVSRSCEQGKILLTAAAKNGNALAKVKLDELKSAGCK